MTDAAVLLSFMLVNLSLPWVARRRLKGARPAHRILDLVLPALALLMCGWLLVHTGRWSLAAAGGLVVLGLLLGRWRPGRGTDAPPPGPASRAQRSDEAR